MTGAPGRSRGQVTALRQVDASMDLLNQIVRQPYDPDYAEVAARGSRSSRFRVGFAVVALLIGALFAVAALQTTRGAPAAEQQRRALITRVQAAQTRQDDLRTQIGDLTDEVAQLRRAILGTDGAAQATQAELDRLNLATSGTPVRGPGLVVVVDDAPDAASGHQSLVTAQDMQVLANGLWAAGAEAVSINGHRLSTTTAIREAGGAVTVDYASITHPYTVEAIGDPRTIEARFAETGGAAWWRALKDSQQMRYDIAARSDITLAADPSLPLRHARVG
ncbi:MAG: DUF881 domain-containing protein [Propionibacteriaceae bacterium]